MPDPIRHRRLRRPAESRRAPVDRRTSNMVPAVALAAIAGSVRLAMRGSLIGAAGGMTIAAARPL